MKTIQGLKSIFLLFFIGLFFFQCTDIQNDRRLLVRGNITTSNNEALANLQVQTTAGGAVLGSSVSDELGNFEFISLVTGMSLQVEVPENFQLTNDEGSTMFRSFFVPISNIENNLLELDKIRIYPFAKVKFNFLRQENNEQVFVLLERKLFQSLNENVYSYNYQQIDYSQEITPFFYQKFNLFISQNQDFELIEIVQKNEFYRMSYQIGNNEPVELEFEINDDYNEFEINL